MTRSGSFPDSGQRIGAYEVQGLLGRGGMGEVFLAWDDRLKRRVAIKRVRSDRGIDAPCRQRLLREARAVAGLSHPAIVQVHDLIEDEAGDCIVLEYVEGKTLAATLAGGALEPAHAIRLAHEIAEGLAAAHGVGVVHRDLKPENVIVTPSGHAKILDFGLARLLTPAADDTQLTQDGVLVGTFHMMSPEQATCGETDERSDLFSLGVVLYEMLTGRSPFRGATPSETLRRVLSEDPPRVDAVRPGLPKRLGDLIEDLLAKEPGARPGSAAEVARELEAAGDSLSLSTAPTLSAVRDDLPTVVDIPRLAASRPVPRPSKSSGSVASQSITDSPGRRTAYWLLATVVLGIILSLAFQPLISRRWGEASPAPLRVLVLKPQLKGHGTHLPLAAAAVLHTTLSTLNSLKGVYTIDDSKLPDQPATEQKRARNVGANEILTIILEEKDDGQGIITLTRQAAYGQHPGEDHSFDAPIEIGDLLNLAKKVDQWLLQNYKGRTQRPGTLPLNARTEDFASYLAVWEKFDKGAVPAQEDIEQLQHIIYKSQDFVEARILAAEVHFSLYQCTHKVKELEKAKDLADGSIQSAPGDPRPRIVQFRINLAEGKTKVAEIHLRDSRFQGLLRDDSQRRALESELEEQKGELQDALKNLKSAVGKASTWQDRYRIANLEAKTGQIGEARKGLQQILDNMPDNAFARDSLARIELLYGDPQKAEQLYQDLVQVANPLGAHYVNLGLARMLKRDYKSAVAAFVHALEMEPVESGQVAVRINLAEAEWGLGHNGKAKKLFQEALEGIKNHPSPAYRLAEAECLAFLGLKQKALSIIKLEPVRDDPDFLLSEALIYARVGDNLTAMQRVEQALEKGVGRHWFHMPGFESLRADPRVS